MLQFLVTVIFIILTVVLIIFLGFALIFACAEGVIILVEAAKTPLFWTITAVTAAAALAVIAVLSIIYITLKKRKEHGSDK